MVLWALLVRELKKCDCLRKTGRGLKVKKRWRGVSKKAKMECLRKTGRGWKVKRKMAGITDAGVKRECLRKT